MNSYELDALDVRIINMLQANARAKVTDIAKALDVPHTTVQMRMRRLEKYGVVRGYKPVLAQEMVGKPLSAVMDLYLEPFIDPEEFGKTIAQFRNIMSVYVVDGESDLTCKLVGRDLDEIHETVMRVKATVGLRRSLTRMVVKTVKNATSVPIDIRR
ncbi:MAG: Lrp/AsnC family transcriptional regulator [Candidatus Diapherotrites archaeon]|nr:Lrp/AsnC family transcriptional regulator [Candidatus Diapherotrites archaeon]